MKTVALTLILVTIFCIGCGHREDNGIPADLQGAIDAFYTAIENGDTGARIALFTDSAVMMPNHWTTYQGKPAIAEMIRSSTGYVFRIRDRKMVEYDVNGDLAYTVNSYSYTWHAEGATPQWHKTKNVHIWKRGADGAWKLHLDIWNSDVPLAAFGEE